jgi:DNA repair protein RadA/Sms
MSELTAEQVKFVEETKTTSSSSLTTKAISITQVKQENIQRFSSGSKELDLVLGGGIVPGSLTLIGGSPGIGKSTLLLKIAGNLAKAKINVLYVSGEESAGQIKLRADRLDANEKEVFLLAEINLSTILTEINSKKYGFIIIDSIQTLYSEETTSAPGSVTQVRTVTFELMRVAKSLDIPIFIIGHITKDGSIAGPRVLEHMVDTVLYFEGDTGTSFRVIRSIKNRFGAVNELGVFSMTDKGLVEVTNPSAIFVSREAEEVPGSIIMVTHEGTRPLLVEVQALVDNTHNPNPRRVVLGLDQNRLAVLLAVLHRHGGIATYDMDIFINVVGGIRINETGADLAILVAVLSSLRNVTLSRNLVVFGEIGLGGEIRPVPNGVERLREAAKHGFRRAIVPKANAPQDKIANIDVVPVLRLVDALHSLATSTIEKKEST